MKKISLLLGAVALIGFTYSSVATITLEEVQARGELVLEFLVELWALSTNDAGRIVGIGRSM